MISNIADAGGLDRAAAAGIATLVIPHHGKTREHFDVELDAALRAAGVDIDLFASQEHHARILSDSFCAGLGRRG